MNIFSNLTSPDSIYIFLWLLGAFILGLIVGWFTWGTAKRRLEETLATLNAEHLALNGEYDTVKLELAGVKAAHTELQADYTWKAQRLHDIEAEKGDLHTEIYSLKDKLKAEIKVKTTLENQMEGLNASYNDAKSETEVLELKVKDFEAELKAAAKSNTKLTNQLEKSKLAHGSDAESTGSDLKKANVKIAILEGNVEGLKEQLGLTKANLADCQAAQTGLSAAAIMTEAEGEESSEEEMSIKDSKAAITTALGGAIGMASADEKDDLTQINGIGEFIEDKLNDLGIYKFEQISNFDDAMIANLTRAIEFFPGRIERDEWVPQAKELSSGNSVSSSILEDLEEEDEIIEVEGAPTVKKVDVEAAKEIVKSKIGSTIPIATADEKDDLKLISGVGPLIEDKLNDLGLFTYEQISLFDSELENRVTDAIEFFPGRIKRDGWVKQAKELLKQKKADIASVQLKAMIGGKISAATADEKDDLKVISGVGPFIEEKINRLGIYSYKQISEFDEEIIKLVTDAIMFFPGRIVRDGWVAQAAELHTTK
jgi:predicted flap endonuclease-1-like 5' DNA nuclease